MALTGNSWQPDGTMRSTTWRSSCTPGWMSARPPGCRTGLPTPESPKRSKLREAMGRKNDSSRQSRLQRKRNKRAAARAARHQKTGGQAASRWDSRQAAATAHCIVLCGGLLAGCGRLTGEMLQTARMIHEVVGGILGRLPIELNAFLHEEREWSLTCTDLESLRDSFEELGAEEVFDRIWSLALTNEPTPTAFAIAQEQDCPHRAALAFEELRVCLDNPKIKPVKTMRAVIAEIEKHGPRSTGLA